MIRHIRTVLFTSAVLALAMGQGHAETVVTLQEAVMKALSRNDMVLAGAKGVEGARYRTREARGSLLPKVTLQERYMKTDTPAYVFSTKINQEAFTLQDLGGAPKSFNDPDAVEDFETTLSVEQILYSRKAFLGVQMAGLSEEAKRLQYSRDRQGVVLRVYEAYLSSLMAEAFLETAETSVQDAEEHLRLAEVSMSAGTGLEADRLRAQVALGEALRLRLKVSNDVELSRRGLGLAMGGEEPARAAPGGAPDRLPDLDALEAAVLDRDDIRAMEKQVLNAKKNIAMAESEFLPDIALFGAFQANDPDAPFANSGTSYRVGIGMQWNLFQGMSSASRRAAARADYEGAEQLLSGMKKEARFRVRQERLRAVEAEQGLKISRDALNAAEESVRLIRLRYENGLTTMATLLDAQAALNRARSEVVRTEMEYLTAVGRAKYEAGLLLNELSGSDAGTGL